ETLQRIFTESVIMNHVPFIPGTQRTFVFLKKLSSPNIYQIIAVTVFEHIVDSAVGRKVFGMRTKRTVSRSHTIVPDFGKWRCVQPDSTPDITFIQPRQ